MLLRILCVFWCVLPFVSEAEIVETKTVAEILPLIDADTWVVLDLDNTVFEGKQALGHTDWFYDKAYALMRSEGISLEEATRACYPEWIEVQKVCPVQSVEQAFLPSLAPFQKQGIVMMGLTHRQPSLVESTLRQLRSLEWTFQPTAPFKDSLVVPSSTPTMYQEGVLFTGEYNKKGEIFVRFLSLIRQKPKKILFVDDKRSHVEDVEKAVVAQGILYLGVHYRATEHVAKVYDPVIAEFQKKFLTQIMSNEAAMLLIEHGIEE